MRRTVSKLLVVGVLSSCVGPAVLSLVVSTKARAVFTAETYTRLCDPIVCCFSEVKRKTVTELYYYENSTTRIV